MRRQSILVVAIIVMVSLGSIPARAGIVVDADFFSEITHTLVTFETDGSGNPVELNSGKSREMPSDEYAALGFMFEPAIKWVNDGGDTFDAAQAIGGSPQIGIPAWSHGDFLIHFSVPVRAFGFWVINNNYAEQTPVVEAYGISGFIEKAQFEGIAIDGTIGEADYGFLGIVADQDITSIHITKEATVLDNFMFSAVPEPATLLLLGLGVVMVRRRQ